MEAVRLRRITHDLRTVMSIRRAAGRAAILALVLTLPSSGNAQLPLPTTSLSGTPSLAATVVAMRAPRSAGSQLGASTMQSLGAKATSGTVWSLAGAAGGLLLGVLVGEAIRQGTLSEDSVTNEYNAKMARTLGIGLIVPLGAALGAAYGVNNIGQTHGNRNAVKGVALATAYAAAAIVIASKIKRDDPDLVLFSPNKDIVVPLPVATVVSAIAAALITDAATTR
jgi:hypothetical protein